MLQLKDALNDVRPCARFVHLHIGRGILRYDGLLLSEIAETLEDKIGARGRDLHVELFTERIHIAADLLEIDARHVDDTREVEAWNLNVLHIRIEELEKVVRDGRLLGVLHTDSEFIRIGRREIECERVIVAHGLDELEKIDHIHAEYVLGRAVIGLEAIGEKFEIDKNRMSLVDGHDLDALGVKLEIGLRKDFLEGFNEGTEGSGLYSLNLKEVSVRVWFDACHSRSPSRNRFRQRGAKAKPTRRRSRPEGEADPKAKPSGV